MRETNHNRPEEVKESIYGTWKITYSRWRSGSIGWTSTFGGWKKPINAQTYKMS